MLPCFSGDNIVNSGVVRFKYSNQVSYIVSPGMKTPYLFYFIFAKFRQIMIASRSLKYFSSALFIHIFNVVALTSKKKMFWPYAPGVVARMTYKISFFYFSFMQLKRKFMGRYVFVSIYHRAISRSSFSANPFPAIVEWDNGNVFPEFIFHRFCHGGIL